MGVEDDLLALIDLIYEAALDSTLWPAALTGLADTTGTAQVSFVCMDGRAKTCDTLGPRTDPATRRFSKVWDHPANKRKALFLSSWNCSIARVGEGETDFKILSAKPIREKMFRGASSLRFV